ncbi:MAG: T9SS type A sorting domain-containing protein [Bacteroidetes bacterium]|nr:MAG: T9SS type A sorting domain-containing protein [Bacteroidota bacterium]
MKIKLLLLISLFTGWQATAQLSGNYTIGGSTPDYPSFTAAINALVGSGVSGPVTFDVRNGVYVEKVVFNDIPGSSSTNTVTFQSEDLDSSVVVLTDSSTSVAGSNWTLQLNGADWVTFKQITIRRTGTGTYGTVVNIGNISSNNRFLNCVLEGVITTSTSVNLSVVYSAAGTTSNDSNMTVMKCRLVNGSYGLYLYGPSATIFEEGTIVQENLFENNFVRGLQLGNQNSPKVNNNRISTNTTSTAFYGMYYTNCDNNLVVQGNTMSSPNGGYGMYFTGCDGAAGVPVNIYNNFIHVGGTALAYGLYFTACKNVNIWYNSVNVASTNATSRCFYLTGATSDKLVIQNNVLVNSGGGVTFYIVTSGVPALSISNYNDLYSSGPNVAYYSTANTPTLTDWQTASGKDANSVSVNPIFASASDLHAFGSGINNLGIPVASVSIDIDGEARDATNPDIGADEFLPLTDNISIVALTQPTALGACGNGNVTLEIALGNLGSSTQSSIPVVIEITGATTLTIFDTVPGPIALNTVVNYTIAQSFSTISGGEYFIKIYSSLGTDQFRNNDTINVKRTFYSIPNDPTAVSPQQGCNTSVGITATPDSGNVIFWYDEATGGNLIGIGNPLTVPISSDTTFYAEAREGSGSGGCLRIVECELGTNDYIEIQNLSGAAFDATGWSVVASNSYTDINAINPNIWALGNFAAGEIQYKSDVSTDNYWGSNLLFNPGSSGWIILLDAGNVVRDFVAFIWAESAIQTMAPIINSTPIAIGTEWNGAGLATCGTNSASRIGNSDNNNLSDWACESATKGTQNANLSASFANCGLGLCGSNRIPVQVNMVTGVSTSLGPDTILVSPFSYLLDAGTGFISYEWSDGSTAQTLTATSPGIYWVTVSGSNGCSFTDSVQIDIFTGLQLLSTSDRLQAYPNPANQNLTINFLGKESIARIVDIKGRVIKEQKLELASGVSATTFNLTDVETGMYIVQVLNADEVLSMKLIVQHP